MLVDVAMAASQNGAPPCTTEQMCCAMIKVEKLSSLFFCDALNKIGFVMKGMPLCKTLVSTIATNKKEPFNLLHALHAGIHGNVMLRI
jgi:hypothetical protein